MKKTKNNNYNSAFNEEWNMDLLEWHIDLPEWKPDISEWEAELIDWDIDLLNWDSDINASAWEVIQTDFDN